MKTKALIILLSIIVATNLYGQQNKCEKCGEPYNCPIHDTISVHDTVRVYISNLDSVTKHLGLSFDEYVKRYLLFATEHDTINSPLSPEIVYLNYFLPMLNNAIDKRQTRWISDVFSVHALHGKLNKKQALLPDSIDLVNSNVDILIKCEGSLATDYFLKSQKLIDSCLVEIFRYVYDVNSITPKKIKGINFYFPQFLFQEKRAMVQFAKSVSLVIGTTQLEPIKNIKLYFSFNKTDAEKNKNYLYSFAGLVDSLLLINNSNNQNVFSEYTTVSKNNSNISFFHKIKNQFYVVRFFTGDFPVTESNAFKDEDIVNIANSDYPANNWEFYFTILCSIIALTIIIIILYWTLPNFAYYLSKNTDYVIMLLLMFTVEAILLVFITLGSMSHDNILNFSDKNKNIILLMPLFVVFFTPLIKLVRNKNNMP